MKLSFCNSYRILSVATVEKNYVGIFVKLENVVVACLENEYLMKRLILERTGRVSE